MNVNNENKNKEIIVNIGGSLEAILGSKFIDEGVIIAENGVTENSLCELLEHFNMNYGLFIKSVRSYLKKNGCESIPLVIDTIESLYIDSAYEIFDRTIELQVNDYIRSLKGKKFEEVMVNIHEVKKDFQEGTDYLTDCIGRLIL